MIGTGSSRGATFILCVFAPLYLFLWIIGLSIAWVLPNHHRPWTAFHVDAWIAIVVLIAGSIVMWRSRKIEWHAVTLAFAILACLPWLQFFLLPVNLQLENAWLAFLYIFGFFLCILVAAQWERLTPNQCLDALFAAITIACLVSVMLQLNQWLQLDMCELLCVSATNRPFANLGQPNQLATLLLWGVVAAGWHSVRGHIRGWLAIALSCWFLFGVALTLSRTAWLGVLILLLCAWLWGRRSRRLDFAWAATGLTLYFVACVLLVSYVNAASSLEEVIRTGSELRPIAWKMFIDAAFHAPWLGYGWNQTEVAHVAAAIDHTSLPMIFTYAHNLLLDLVLWCGIPIGGAIFAGLCVWVWQQSRKVVSLEEGLIFMALLVVGNHAMLELPLYYAYFLFPVGLMIGTLCTRLQNKIIFRTGKVPLAILLLTAAILLGVLIRDYARVESSYNLLRMEMDGFAITSPRIPPDTQMLTLWRDYIHYARVVPQENMSRQEIEWMRGTVTAFPYPRFMYQFATVLALNHQPQEAQVWLRRICKLSSADDCQLAQTMWQKTAKSHKEIAAVEWPKN